MLSMQSIQQFLQTESISSAIPSSSFYSFLSLSKRVSKRSSKRKR